MPQEYHSVILTHEEEQEALLAAKKRKYFELQRIEYSKKVNTPIVYEDPTFSEFAKQKYELAKQIIGEKFEFGTPEERELFVNLCKYFSATDGEFDLKKGIYIQGNFGVGKTALMKIFSDNPVYPYILKNCSDVSRDYQDNGTEAIEQYCDLVIRAANRYGIKERAFCFDDLGNETIDTGNYGNRRNVMREILEARYERRAMTFVTTNLSSEKIIELYGMRVYDRILDMFNVVDLYELGLTSKRI